MVVASWSVNTGTGVLDFLVHASGAAFIVVGLVVLSADWEEDLGADA